MENNLLEIEQKEIRKVLRFIDNFYLKNKSIYKKYYYGYGNDDIKLSDDLDNNMHFVSYYKVVDNVGYLLGLDEVKIIDEEYNKTREYQGVVFNKVAVQKEFTQFVVKYIELGYYIVEQQFKRIIIRKGKEEIELWNDTSNYLDMNTLLMKAVRIRDNEGVYKNETIDTVVFYEHRSHRTNTVYFKDYSDYIKVSDLNLNRYISLKDINEVKVNINTDNISNDLFNRLKKLKGLSQLTKKNISIVRKNNYYEITDTKNYRSKIIYFK